MGEFITLEEAAERLGVAETVVRNWIKKGQARASRRGGGYYLRLTEVERLRDKADTTGDLPAASTETRPRLELPKRPAAAKPALPSWATDSTQEGEESVPEPSIEESRPKPLPPRPRDPAERRKRLGRRASDFSLDIMAEEVKRAVREVLQEAREDVSRPTPPAVNEEELAGLRAQLQESQQQQQIAIARSAELTQELQELKELVKELQMARLEASGSDASQAAEWIAKVTHLEAAREEFRRRLETSESARQEGLREAETLRAENNQLQEQLESLRSQMSLLYGSHEKLESEMARLKIELQDASSSALAIEGERTRWASENRSLRAELDRLRDVNDRRDDSRQQMEQELQRLKNELELTLQQHRQREQDWGLLNAQFEDREQTLNQENRRLKEEVKGLQFKLQMSGPGGGGPTFEDSRKLMARLADMEGQMVEKDRLITQGYNELSELRSKLEAYHRNYYELQQRYDREKEEWSNLVAHQLQMADRLTTTMQQQQTPAPQPPVDRRWGLFKPRGDNT